jgi:hypothetical protein
MIRWKILRQKIEYLASKWAFIIFRGFYQIIIKPFPLVFFGLIANFAL